MAEVVGNTHRPPHVGNALTISAIDDPMSWFRRQKTLEGAYLPKVKHMVDPRIQHHVTYEEDSDVIA